PDILRRMVDLGCEIASHSNSHYDLTTLSRDAMLTDLAKLDQIIYDATGITPTLVRPPYGAVNSMVKYESGRAMILWTVDTKDWLYRDAQVLTDYFMNYGDLDGEIVLMHSIHASTAEAMAGVVPWLIEQGYQLVTVSELMAYYYGELLEANHYYNQTYFAKHSRTEYPIELPSEPMQTDIPPYTVVPVVPMPEPEDTPSDTPEQPDGESSEQAPAEGSEGEIPPSEDEQGTEPTPPDTEEEPTLPPDEGTIVPDAPGENTSDEEVPPTDESEDPTADEGTVPPDEE
ncbi:MAG: polysaccharide deacetylase family protein, partial [Oscillospiraceae bacterium]|nr:polysaccharide deacetylase family protein [Oscillospiraceae bacterium]